MLSKFTKSAKAAVNVVLAKNKSNMLRCLANVWYTNLCYQLIFIRRSQMASTLKKYFWNEGGRIFAGFENVSKICIFCLPKQSCRWYILTAVDGTF